VPSPTTSQSLSTAFPKPPSQPLAGVPAGQALRQDPQIDSVLRRVGLYFLLGLLVLFYTRLHETLAAHYQFSNHLLYVFSVPALVGLVLSGGLRRAFSERAIFYWSAFVVWMVVSIPFSVWRGGSFNTVFDFLRAQFPIMILLAGLPMTWKDCRLVLCTIGVSGVINVVTGLAFGQTYGDRVGLESETIGNPNDYAGQLLMVVPFVIYMVMHPPRVLLMRTVLRVTGSVVVLYGIYLILASGSRGALLGLLSAAGFALMKASTRMRVALVFTLALSFAVVTPFLPQDVLLRLTSFSAQSGSRAEQTQSASLRKQLLLESLLATVTHPLLGVGPGQFGNFEGREKEAGSTEHIAAYIEAHNSYTQISADNGFPGLLLYLAGMISPFLLLLRIWKNLRGIPAQQEKAAACFCLLAAWVGYCVAIFFLNFGYYFYLPAFAGLALAVSAAVGRELAAAAPVRMSPAGVNMVGVNMAAPRPAMAAAAVPPAPSRTVSSNRFRFNRYR